MCIYQISRTKSRATRKINFEEKSQTFTISSLNEKSVEDTNISLQVGFSCQMLDAFFCNLVSNKVKDYSFLTVSLLLGDENYILNNRLLPCACSFYFIAL